MRNVAEDAWPICLPVIWSISVGVQLPAIIFVDRRHHAENTDPVGDKIGPVPCRNHFA